MRIMRICSSDSAKVIKVKMKEKVEVIAIEYRE